MVPLLFMAALPVAAQNEAPTGDIDAPAADVTITAGESVDFTATASDPDGDTPLTFLWSFGSGSGIADATVEDPGSVQFDTPGTFTVTFTVTDALGLADPTPATRTITVEPPNVAPTGDIDTPAADVTITAGESVDFTATVSDPDGDTPLTFLWSFGTGSGIADATVEDPGTVQFDTPGTFTVTFTVTDALGLADPTPATRTITVEPPMTVIPQGDWTLHYVDSQETTGENAPATNAFDGNPSTYWHSQWSGTRPTLPHELQINLGGLYEVSGFRYLPRQDGKPNGRIGQYEFYVSTDGQNWGAAVATGAFVNTAAEQQVEFAPKTGTFVRLRAITDLSGTNYRTAVAEINVLQTGTGNRAPQSAIGLPAADVTISVGETVEFASSSADPDGHLPLAYHWSFGAGSGLADSTVANPGPLVFNESGTFLVTHTVTDALGLADSTPATRTVTVSNSSTPTAIPQSGWTLRFVDSQETVGENGAAVNAFDGNPATYWHSQWLNAKPPLPHEIQIDLGATYSVSAFSYLPRQDGKPNGRIASYEFYVSADGSNWGSPVASGTFANTAGEKQAQFTSKSGRYVRLRALSEHSGTTYRTSAAEINVFQGGAPNQPPDGAIDAPASDVIIAAGSSVSFSGSGSDPDGHLPLSYLWNFGAGSGVPNSTAQNPGSVTFNTAGEFDVTLTVTDALGAADPTPATRTVTVQPPPGTAIPQGNWGVHFVDSEETTGENGAAANAFDGNPGTLWHSEWLAAKPTLPHEIQINLSGNYTVNGFRYLPRQDGRPNGRIGQYEFYVSNDGANWGAPVASGTFANNATEKQVDFAPRSARYVRLRALTDQSGTNYRTSAAEINVLHTGTPGNLAPNGTITSPATNLTIAAGASVTFSGDGSDPDNHTPLTYLWNFGSGSGIADSTQQNPGAVTFATAGTFTVRFTVTDALGLSDGSPATRVITVKAPEPVLLSRTGWTLLFADSHEPASVFAGKSGVPQHAFDGNPRTIWHTRSVTAQPVPPHEIQIDLNATHEIAGFRYLPRQDNLPKGRIGRYEFYVTTNISNWGSPVATGLFEDTELEREVFFPAKTGRFVRLRALTEANGNPFTAVAELNVLALGSSSTSAPDGAIVSPASDLTISAGSVLRLTASGTDPDNSTPLRYRWTFSSGAKLADIALQSPDFIEFNIPGTHTIALHVTDGWGMTDSTPATRTITVQGGTPIDPTAWTVHAVDSEDLVANHPGVHAIDGNSATFWQTLPGVLPHEIQIDLGAFHDIGGLRYLPRQEGSEGRLGSYQFFVSADGNSWHAPVVGGVFANTTQVQEVQFSSTVARYVRLQSLTEVNSLPSTSIAELGLLEAAFVAPTIRLLEPRSYALQTSDQLRVRADGFVPAGRGVRLSLDGVTHVDDYLWPFDAVFSGVALAEHTVSATIIDPDGTPVPGPTTHDEAVNVGIGDYYIALGDSITYGIADDVPADHISLDGRNRGGGWTPILADLLSAAAGHPVHIANEGKPGELSRGGAARIAAVLAKHPQAQRVFVMYGTNDAGGFDGVPVPSGLGLSPGDANYAGSFKASMQAIIDAILGAGKTPLLAKLPYVRGIPDADARVQEYNLVIDELVANAANGIPVAPPDFHTYFATRATAEYYPNDAVHPNGIGFQSMANLWFLALTSGD